MPGSWKSLLIGWLFFIDICYLVTSFSCVKAFFLSQSFVLLWFWLNRIFGVCFFPSLPPVFPSFSFFESKCFTCSFLYLESSSVTSVVCGLYCLPLLTADKGHCWVALLGQFCSSYSFPRLLLSSVLIRPIWFSAQRASTNLVDTQASQDASTQRWLWCLSTALAAVPLRMRMSPALQKSSVSIRETYSSDIFGHGERLHVKLCLESASGFGGDRKRLWLYLNLFHLSSS